MSITSFACVLTFLLYKNASYPLPVAAQLQTPNNWTTPFKAIYQNWVSSFQFSASAGLSTSLVKWSRRKLVLKSNPRSHTLLILLLANDIAVNPGPYQPKFPCVICKKAAKYGQHAIECESCNEWFHRSCLGMKAEIYNVLAEHASYSWTCCNCGLANFDSSFFSGTSMDLMNSFEPLGSVFSDCDDENLSSNDIHAQCAYPVPSSPKRTERYHDRS